MHAEEVFDVGDWVERKDGNALWGDVYRAQVRRSTSDLVVFGEEYKWQKTGDLCIAPKPKDADEVKCQWCGCWVCGARDGGYECTRHEGHDGDHVACGSIHGIHRWPQLVPVEDAAEDEDVEPRYTVEQIRAWLRYLAAAGELSDATGGVCGIAAFVEREAAKRGGV